MTDSKQCKKSGQELNTGPGWLEILKGWAGLANLTGKLLGQGRILGDSQFLYKMPIITLLEGIDIPETFEGNLTRYIKKV